jgi:hypothetical protein
METNEKRIAECFEAISRLSPKPETMARDLERAHQTVLQQASICPAKKPGVLDRLMKSRAARIAAVLCLGTLIALLLLDRGIEVDGAKAALAQVLQALEEAPLMHKVLNTRYEGPETYLSEDWYDFRSRTVVGKYSVDGRCRKISSLNYGTKEHVAYDPETDIVTISYYLDVPADTYPDSAAGVVAEYLKNYRFWGAEMERERSRYEGVEVDVYHLKIEPTPKREKQYAALIVNAQTNLPMAISKDVWNAAGVVKFSQGITFDFPARGPKDIYDLGAPRSAQVVVDAASKERHEKKIVLEQRIPQLKERFERSLGSAYRLSDRQVLALIPPALVKPRLEWEQAEDEVRRLAEEQERERIARSRAGNGRGPGAEKGRDLAGSDQIPSRFQCFTWDDGIDLREPRPVFRGAVTLQEAFDRIIGLSAFEYEILQDPTEVNIPGDWVVRKGSSKEQRMAAFEKIVRECTGRPIVFQPSRVEQEVVVARGRFHFQPLSGTYDDSWIHVYADQLDPDSRGGGGSGSLAKFLRRLGEVNFDQPVVDETQGDREVKVNYGWHMSGYIRRITNEKERARKLRLVLDNVSRQTGLTFIVERRWITVWRITQDGLRE